MIGTCAFRNAYYPSDQSAQCVENICPISSMWCNEHRGVTIEVTYFLGLNKTFFKLQLRFNKCDNILKVVLSFSSPVLGDLPMRYFYQRCGQCEMSRNLW